MSLLGPTAVRADRGWVALRSSPRRRLLELLAIHAGKPVPIAAIVAELWGGGPPEWPREAVQTQIRRLRKSFAELPLRSSDEGYLLDLPPENVDALHMVMLVQSAAELGDEDATRTLEQALDLWSGEPFGGMSLGPHHAKAAQRWNEVRSLALRRWADAQLRLGRPKPVISRLRAERVGDFADEELYRLLIDALGQVAREVEESAQTGEQDATVDQDGEPPADDQPGGRSSR